MTVKYYIADAEKDADTKHSKLRREKTMDDLISRQAAIELIERMKPTIRKLMTSQK